MGSPQRRPWFDARARRGHVRCPVKPNLLPPGFHSQGTLRRTGVHCFIDDGRGAASRDVLISRARAPWRTRTHTEKTHHERQTTITHYGTKNQLVARRQVEPQNILVPRPRPVLEERQRAPERLAPEAELLVEPPRAGVVRLDLERHALEAAGPREGERVLHERRRDTGAAARLLDVQVADVGAPGQRAAAGSRAATAQVAITSVESSSPRRATSCVAEALQSMSRSVFIVSCPGLVRGALGRVEEHLRQRPRRSLERRRGVEERRRFGLLRRELQCLRDCCAEEQQRSHGARCVGPRSRFSGVNRLFRVVLLPQAFLPRFDPCATSTAVPRLLGRVAGLQEQSLLHAARDAASTKGSGASLVPSKT